MPWRPEHPAFPHAPRFRCTVLLRRGSASPASALHVLMQPTGLVMSWAVLGEPLHWLDLLGVVPIGYGIWLTTRAAPGAAAASLPAVPARPAAR